MFNEKIILNPFYLSIEPNNDIAIQSFKILYESYINLLREKYTGTLSEQKEQSDLTQFIQSFPNKPPLLASLLNSWYQDKQEIVAISKFL